jgi:glycerol-3-phosphate dehydrogenase
MRPRDLDRLASSTYDVLVVGGGIYGLACAYEAASRGLEVALVEAGDFGGGISFNHQKTIHGGLRSLQTGRLDRAREAVRERRALARIAPWFLRPLPFLVGTYRSALRGRTALRAGFKVDTWIARDRNRDVEPELHLPAPRLISKAATLRLFPGINPRGLTGGAQWYDYQAVESERLTFAFAAAADRAGADLGNYVEATEAILDGRRVRGMRVRDTLGGATFDVSAAIVLNAAGASAGAVMASFGVSGAPPLLKAMNLMTSRRASDMALGAPSSEGRMLTLVPWRGHALIGTAQSPTFVERSDTGVTRAEIDAFIAGANEAFPALKLTRDEITLVYRGLVPAAGGRNGQPELRAAPQMIDHARRHGIEGAVTIAGVKYTTARGVAEWVVDMLAKKRGKRIKPSRTAFTSLPGAGIADHEALAIERARRHKIDVPLPLIRHLIGKYAEQAAGIVSLLAERPDLAAPVTPAAPTVAAEIVHVIRTEMAMRLSDVVIRRTALGASGHPGEQAVRACATVAAAELGWDEARTTREVEDVNAFYQLPA